MFVSVNTVLSLALAGVRKTITPAYVKVHYLRHFSTRTGTVLTSRVFPHIPC